MLHLMVLLAVVSCSVGSEREERAVVREDTVHGKSWSAKSWRSFFVQLGTISVDPSTHRVDFFPICGGSIIHSKPTVILTSAHCVLLKSVGADWNQLANEYYAAIGDTNSKEYLLERVEYVSANPSFTRKKDKAYGDIALVYLLGQVPAFAMPLGTGVRVLLNLQKSRYTDSFMLRTAGYGGDETHSMSERVEDAKMHYLSREWCQRVFGVFLARKKKGTLPGWVGQKGITGSRRSVLHDLVYDEWVALGKPMDDRIFPDEICGWDITQRKRSNCAGDSGGPLFRKQPSSGVFGVVSGSLVGGCEAYLPVIYSSVAYYKSWIDTTVNGLAKKYKDVRDDKEYLQKMIVVAESNGLARLETWMRARMSRMKPKKTGKRVKRGRRKRAGSTLVL